MEWGARTASLVDGAQATWPGLWSLLYTAGHSALRLSLVAPFSDGVELAYVAMDLREARDELEWLHEDVSAGAGATDPGPIRPGEDREAARDGVHQLIDAALGVSLLLAEGEIDSPELACLTRVEHRLRSAQTTIAQLPS